MILKLVIKDIKAYKSIFFLKIILPLAIFSSIFHFQFYRWDIFIINACMVISAAGSVFSFSEQKEHIENLTCSLPVSRISMVFARYLTSFFITILGITTFYFCAFISDLIHTNPKMHFHQIYNFKVVFITFFFIIVYNAIFLPSVFRFKTLGMIITIAIAMATAVTATAIIFHPYKLFIPYITSEEYILLIVLSLLMIFASVFLSISIYKKRDL